MAVHRVAAAGKSTLSRAAILDRTHLTDIALAYRYLLQPSRAAGSARSHFRGAECSTAQMKGTRGTRDFPRDALVYAKWLQRHRAPPALQVPASSAYRGLLGRSPQTGLFMPARVLANMSAPAHYFAEDFGGFSAELLLLNGSTLNFVSWRAQSSSVPIFSHPSPQSSIGCCARSVPLPHRISCAGQN